MSPVRVAAADVFTISLKQGEKTATPGYYAFDWHLIGNVGFPAVQKSATFQRGSWGGDRSEKDEIHGKSLV
jgi:hypothetical protein